MRGRIHTAPIPPVDLHSAAPPEPGDHRWIATVAGRRVGQVRLSGTGSTIATLHELIVVAGLESSTVPCQLVQAAAEYAHDLGYLKLVVNLAGLSARARDLLRCIGFVPGAAGPTRTYYLDLYRPPRRQDCIAAIQPNADGPAPDDCRITLVEDGQ